MKKYNWLLSVLLIGLGACGSSHHGAQMQEPFAAPVAAPVASPASSEADKVISYVRQHYFVGERELSLGHL